MKDSDRLYQQLHTFQKNEITEYHIYTKLARVCRDAGNSRVLSRIAEDERRHYDILRTYTDRDARPDMLRVWFYYWLCRIAGVTFGIKLMESGESRAQENYTGITQQIPEAGDIVKEENDHEEALIALIDEERLRYTGSMVLGLNDALVELTGALAGFTLALQNSQLIALTGLVTGIAAALSMAASEYLSTKTEETEKNPVRASAYTGAAYFVTVIVLILPYLLLANYYISLVCVVCTAVLIIALFTYYISVAQGLCFKKRFFEMAGLSLGVTAISFVVGIAARQVLGVDV